MTKKEAEKLKINEKVLIKESNKIALVGCIDRIASIKIYLLDEYKQWINDKNGAIFCFSPEMISIIK